MDLFNLMAKLNLDSSGYDKGLRSAERGGKNLASKLEASFTKIQRIIKTSLAAVAVKKLSDSMLSLANATATAGDRIDKQSQKLGLSRQSYQEWDYILRQNGADIDSMAISMKTMTEAITGGSSEAKKAFSDLGVDMKLLKSLTPEQQFDYLIHQFQQMPDGANKSAAALEIFGRNGYDLLPLLNSSSDSVWELKDQMAQLGLYMSDDAVDAAVKYGDSVDTLKTTFNAFKYAVGAEVLPILTDAVDTMTSYLGKLKKAYDENGFAGVWQTLVDDIKKIRWPTWDDVWYVITTAWDTIVEGVAGLTKIAYGALVDIGIPLPDWELVASAINTGWQTVTTAFDKLARIVFGEKADGTIDFPDWQDIADVIKKGWKIVLGAFEQLGKIIFGDKFDLNMDLPDWDGIAELIKKGWSSLLTTVAALPDIIFGDNTFVSDSLENVFNFLKDVGAWLIDNWRTVAVALGGIFAAIEVSKLTSLVAAHPILSAIVTLITLIATNWDTIKPVVEEIGVYINTYIIQPIEDAIKWIKELAVKLGIIDEPMKSLDEVRAEEHPEVSQEYWNWQDDAKDAVLHLKNLDEHQWADEFVANAYGKSAQQLAEETGISIADADKELKNFKAEVEKIMGKEYVLSVSIKYNGDSLDNGVGVGYLSGGTSGNYATPFASNAKGLWTVPYDNYITRLHRGERVLSASQARHDGGVDTDTIVQAVTTAISQSMKQLMGSLKIELNNKQVGKVVGDSVSTRVNNNIGSIQDRIAYGYGR